MQIPLKLNITTSAVDKRPIKITFKAIMLGIRIFPDLAWTIFISSVMKVKKYPLNAAAEANE